MKGYYCIYECSKNQWVGEWGQPIDDMYVEIKSIPTEWNVLLVEDFEGNKTPTLVEAGHTNVNSVDENYQIYPESMRKFASVKEAEEYILSDVLPSSHGQFYSIRKIYY